MENRNGEVHTETDEARGGSTPHIVRWILVISTLAAIVLLSAIWIFGALSQGDVEQEVTATSIAEEREERRDIDGVLIQQADEFAPDTAAGAAEQGENDAIQTIEN